MLIAPNHTLRESHRVNIPGRKAGHDREIGNIAPKGATPHRNLGGIRLKNGFCYGGGIANDMAVRFPELSAAAPFYGSQPSSADVPRIRAPLLLHYAGLDQRVNRGWPAYEAALKKHGKEYTAHVYPGVNHGFHNDTTPRYDAAAAKLAWHRTIEFFWNKLA